MKRYFPWLSAVVVLTIVFGTIYVAVQQDLRLSVNYPQVQLAEDLAAQLKQGSKPASLVGGRVNLAQSLAPFVIIYDQQGKVVAGTGYLDGQLLGVPLGVLTSANHGADNRVTVQPRSDVRLATVTVKAGNYYVLSGRSLREVEATVDVITKLVAFGWLASLAAVGVTFWLSRSAKSK